MKKIFTLILLLSSMVGMRAADVVLFEADFTQSPYAGHSFTTDQEFEGIYARGESISISAAGVMSYASGGNMNGNRFCAVKVTGVNKTLKVTFTMDGSKALRYVIKEESNYNKNSAGSNTTDLKNNSSYEVDYTMTGDGSDAIIYFGQQGSGTPSGLKGIKVTTPDASTVTTIELVKLVVSGKEVSESDLNTLKSAKTLTISDAIEGKPIVNYTVKTTITDSNGTNSSEVTEMKVATDEGAGYTTSFNAGTESYTLNFTSVTVPTVLDITGKTSVEVRITQSTYLSQAYFTSTDTWADATINGEPDKYFNMAGTGRDVAIKVKGAKYVEVLAQNASSDATRTYRIAIDSNTAKTINPGTTGGNTASSGIISVNETGAEATLNILTDGVGIRLYKAIFYETQEATAITSLQAADAENAAVYNVAGQKVGEGYKGLIIKNGKKYVIK